MKHWLIYGWRQPQWECKTFLITIEHWCLWRRSLDMLFLSKRNEKLPLVSERIKDHWYLLYWTHILIRSKRESYDSPFCQKNLQISNLNHRSRDLPSLTLREAQPSSMNMGPPYVTLLSMGTTDIHGQFHAVSKKSFCKNRTGVLASLLKKVSDHLNVTEGASNFSMAILFRAALECFSLKYWASYIGHPTHWAPSMLLVTKWNSEMYLLFMNGPKC